jgi:hypothetical protein
MEISFLQASPHLFNEKNWQSNDQAVFPTLLNDPSQKYMVPAFLEAGSLEKRSAYAHNSRSPKKEGIRGAGTLNSNKKF